MGDLLIEAGIISEEQLKRALELQKQSGDRLGRILIDNNFVSETQIMEVLEFQLGIPFIDLNEIENSSRCTKTYSISINISS